MIKNRPLIFFAVFYPLLLISYLVFGTNLFFPFEYDTLMKLRGPRPNHSDIVLITIDDPSVELLGSPWPWDRKKIAEALSILASEKPRLMALDLLFSEKKDPSSDAVLETTLTKLSSSFPILLAGSLEGDFQSVFSGLKQIPTLSYQLQKPLFPLPYGLVNAPLSPDGKIRSAQLFFPLPQETLSHFSLCAAYLSQNSNLRHCPARESLNFFSLPDSSYLINFLGPINPFPTLSMFQVLRQEIPPGLLRNKILFVGTRLPSIQDFHTTPYFDNSPQAPRASGLEILATLSENVLGGYFYKRSSMALNILIFLLLFTGLALLHSKNRYSALYRKSLSYFLILLPLLLSWVFFTFFHLYFPGFSLFFFLGLLFISCRFINPYKTPSALHPTPPAWPSDVKFLIEGELTVREKEILPWLLEDLKISTLSKQLQISESTLKKHINNIYQKFSVKKRSELIHRIGTQKTSAS